MTPKELAHKVEAENVLPEGTEERFNGFGVMGIPFSSGHMLALRRFAASSIGKGYTSVWHRSPDKRWNFYANVDPRLSCTRYFGKIASHAYVTPITIKWLNDYSFEVKIESIQFYWYVKVKSTPATLALNAIGRLLPDWAWKNELLLGLIEKVAGAVLGVQKVGLSGTVPNGQHFIANPKILWVIKESRASIAGKDIGTPFPLLQQEHLQDFWIPQKGILAFGQAYFSPFDPRKHSAATAGSYSNF